MFDLIMRLPILRKLDHHMREVLRGGSIALLLKVLASVLTLTLNVVLARMLGAEGAGVYFQGLTVALFAAVFGRMGMASTLLRFTAANAASGNWAAVKGLYLKGILIALGASLVAAAVVAGSGKWLANFVFSDPKLGVPLCWMSLAVVPLSLSFIYAYLLKAVKRIRDALSVESAVIPGAALLGTLVAVPAWGVLGAIWAYTLATVVALLVGFCLWHRATPQMRGVVGHFDTKEMLASSMPLFWASLLQLVTSWSSTFMLGIWRTSTEVGLFAVPNRTAMIITYFHIALTSIAAPKFATLYSQGDIHALGSTARNSAKLMTIAAAPICVIFMIAPNLVMSIFGPQFSESGIVLVILTVGQFVNVATGAVQIALNMCGYERLMRNITAVCAVLLIVANALLIPRWGKEGAAIATSVTLIVQNLLAAWLVRLRLGVWTIPFVRSRLGAK
jgi:O-antigen/teichoic acid export membrane protein